MVSMKNDRIIMYESDEAASIKTVTGWVSREGIFWGDNERQARWGGCTHKLCDCGNITPKNHIRCGECSDKLQREKYLNLPFREYDGEPVVIWNGEDYFFSEGEIIDFLEEHELEEIELLFCRSQNWTTIDTDVWQDIMPEDEYELPPALKTALGSLNEVISKLPPCSYFPGYERTIYKIQK